jgi:glucose-specific phosphotransferase system IIA component
MGFWNMFKGKASNEEIRMKTNPQCIYAPVEGEVIPLKEIGDDVFSEEILGKGCGIKPSENTIVAPFDGMVCQIAETKHAIGLRSNAGIEVLIHVGMDTVDMNGAGFQLLVHAGEKVKCGQLLMTFSISNIEAAGHPATIAVIVTNSEQYEVIFISGTGPKKRLEKLLNVVVSPSGR